MKKYAMILNNLVIDIIESDIPPAYPPDPKGNIVIAVECDDSIKLGMGYYADTGFGEYKIPTKELSEFEVLLQEIQKKNTDIENSAVDRYTEELMKGGLL
jgi:hypothetical protein|nr:MAG TPA: putative S-adenosylmethionine:2-demethylmenaquinone methyltransferase [Caudoviricetes sp.]